MSFRQFNVVLMANDMWHMEPISFCGRAGVNFILRTGEPVARPYNTLQ